MACLVSMLGDLMLCYDAGHSPSARRQIAATFAAIAGEHGGQLNRTQAMGLLAGLTGGSGDNQEAAELLWTEMGLAPDAQVTQVLSSAPYRAAPIILCSVTM